MINDDDLKESLSDTPVPGIQSSHHKNQLKYELMDAFPVREGREVKRYMKLNKVWVFAVLAVLILATAALAYQQYQKRYEVTARCEGDTLTTTVTDEEGVTREFVTTIDPNQEGPIIVRIGPDGEPEYQTQLPQEILDALASGNFEVTEKEGEDCQGNPATIYHYKFNFDDGRVIELEVPCKLDELGSEQTEEEE